MNIKDYCYTYDTFVQEIEKNITQPAIPVDFLKRNGFTDDQITKLSSNPVLNADAISNALAGTAKTIQTPDVLMKSASSVLYPIWFILFFFLK